MYVGTDILTCIQYSGVILFYIFICIRAQVYSYAYNILGAIFIWECFDLWAPICDFWF